METLQPFGNKLVAGDTWQWSVTLPDYPASAFTLKWFFRGAGTLDVVAAADGSSFKATASGSATANLPTGTYSWQCCVFDASANRTELARGQVEILPDIQGGTGQASDDSAWVKRSLDAVRAVLSGRASRVEAEYTINGRQLRLCSLKELTDFEGYLTARYRRMQIESGELPPQTNEVHFAFGDPSDATLARLWRNLPGSNT